MQQDTFIHGVRRVVVEQPEIKKDDRGEKYTVQRIVVMGNDGRENRVVLFSDTGEAFKTVIK